MLAAVVVAVLATAPSQGAGQGSIVDDVPLEPLSNDPPAVLLQLADDARAHGDTERCNKQAQQALQSGQLDVDQVAHAWLLRGRCLSLRGDVDKAQRAYAVLLRVQPSAHLEDGDAGDASFAAAKQSLDPLRFRAARVPSPPGPEDTVELEIVADDMQLVRGARFEGDSVRDGARDGEELARFPVDAAHATHRVSGLGAGTLVAVVLDKHGNALARTAVGDEPEHVVTPAPLAKNGDNGGSNDANITWMTTIGATAIGAGIVGVVASGIAVTSLGDKALADGAPWLIGVGASTGLFLVGASLVVVDQGLGPTK